VITHHGAVDRIVRMDNYATTNDNPRT